MPVMQTLAAIGRFIRRTPPPPADLLDAYLHEVVPVLDRAEWLYEYWLEQSTLFTDSEKLGNVAAIHRWEIATMGRSLGRVIPPSVLADAHERVIDALDLASRAAQLLSNGSRFHNANAVCEGQAMLTVSRERRLSALRSMRRYLARVQPVASPEADAASSPGLAEAATLATRSPEASPPSLPTADPSADGSLPAGPAMDAAAPNAERPVDGYDERPESPWPELAEVDLTLTDEAEPAPAWLSAARADAPSADAPADQTVEPTPDQPSR